MKMKQVGIIFLILLCATSVVNADDLTIIQTTDNSLTIEFYPQAWDISTKKINEQEFTVVRFLHNQILTAAGKPMASCRSSMIGIPVNSKVDYQIIDVVYGQKIKGRLLPTPSLEPKSTHFIDENIYKAAKNYPGKLIELSKPAFYRDQQVVNLKLFPVQFSPPNNEIQLIDKITVKFTFISSNSSEYQRGKTNNLENASYSAILNHSQAKSWRKPQAVKQVKKRSIFPNNDYYKIFTDQDGFYKITGKYLQDNGINISAINPNNVKIYNNGGTELPRPLFTPRPDSLIENAIKFVDINNDGNLNEADYFLFYARSLNNWNKDHDPRKFSHYINHYTYENIYWLTWDSSQPGKRITAVNYENIENSILQTSFWNHVFLENENENPIDSGIDWYGHSFTSTNMQVKEKNLSLNLTGAIPEDSVSIKIRFAGTSAGIHNFETLVNDHLINSTQFYSYTLKYVYIAEKTVSIDTTNILIDGYNDLKIRYTPSAEYSKAYLDWIELHYKQKLVADNNELNFYSVNRAGTYRYQLTNFTANDVQIFDITNFNNVKQFTNFTTQNNTILFTDFVESNLLKQYLAINDDKIQIPIRMEKDETSNLRNYSQYTDFIIITHDDFYEPVLKLREHRENGYYDNLRTKVVKISNIYDEFSWGLFDPVAIRDFIKFAYNNWGKPDYVLLVGTADYDYRNIIDEVDNNWIPTFQTLEKYEGESRARDGWFVCVSGDDDIMDLAIGRLPVRTSEQTQNVVDKIINYHKNPEPGDWKNSITLVADDLTGEYHDVYETEHTHDTEIIAEYFLPKSFNINKIYLVDYPPVYTASITGIRKPDAQNDIVEAVNEGQLIINYIGHGRYDLWAHEVVLDMDQDLVRIDNGNKQALWIAATCYFGRFDNPAYECMSEELILKKDSGAIAVFSSARLVQSGPNALLNEELYLKLFPTATHKIRIGDAIKDAKNIRGNEENDQKTLLFGDPTLFLNNPLHKVRITNITPDTIKALKLLDVTGEVQKHGVVWSEFNGDVFLKTFDSRKKRTYIYNDDKKINYWLPGNTVFRGIGKADEGIFNFKFIIPKDITYGGDDGRINVYFEDDGTAGAGFVANLPVGGTDLSLVDKDGPDISIFLEDTELFDGCAVNDNSVLSIELNDDISGINIAGAIGHNIVITIDDEKQIITEKFNYNENSYTKGTIHHQLTNLTEGQHTLSLKAWDNSNNSNTMNMNFNVISNDELGLKNVLNYPNPFSDITDITFITNQNCDVEIKIYTVAGRLIKKITNLSANRGFNSYRWNGYDEDDEQVGNGVYLYKIKINKDVDNKNLSTEAIEKMMVIR